MVLGFNKRFKPNILDGTKKHSIRIDQHARWHKGRTIHFATGVRTNQYNEFKRGECISTEYIKIKWGLNGPCVFIGVDREHIDQTFYVPEGYGYHQMLKLAKNDGFDSIDDFFKWFNKDFTGVIIHWTELRYGN